MKSYRIIKRICDIVFSLILIIVCLPLMIVISFIIKISDVKAPILFKHQRPGVNEKPFYVLKYRTMRFSKEPLSDQERLTSLGRILRKFSLDELPQLYNVLTGEMSFIGPRPLLMSYLPYYTKEERIRHTVRPGITGLAQVNGRNHLPWDERLAMDVHYVENLSVNLDIKILIKTILKLFKNQEVIVDTYAIEGNLAEQRHTLKQVE